MTNDRHTEAERQSLRLRRALIAIGGCVAFTAVAWTARGFGLVELGPIAFWVLFGPWLLGCSAFAALIRFGVNERLADPSMTVPQLLWAALGPLMLHPFAPAVPVLTYLGLVVIGLFGAFRLGNVRYALVNAALATGLALALAGQIALWPDRVQLATSVIGYAGCVLALAVITLVGFELNGFRRELTARNDELVLAFDRLREMAVRDELTGIHNRRFLMEALAQQKALADRSSAHNFTLCFVDLDHFKRVNDVIGHGKGDLVLKRFAQIASDAVRDVDYVARLGGEEFVLVLVGTDATGAAVVAERIRVGLADVTVSDLLPEFRITASCGITEYQKGEPVDGTMSRADAALYRAKRAGRDRIVVADGTEQDETFAADALAAVEASGELRASS